MAPPEASPGLPMYPSVFSPKDISPSADFHRLIQESITEHFTLSKHLGNKRPVLNKEARRSPGIFRKGESA